MEKKITRLSLPLLLAGALTCAMQTPLAAIDFAAQAQTANHQGVSGQVLDEFGEPVIGASVLVEGTTIGSVTDIDGRFEIAQAKAGDKLRISFVGYTTQHLAALATPMTINLEPDNQILEETVVIGYGVQKKSNVTGAISSVKAEDLANSVNSSAAQSLQGKVSGVQVVNASGAPGAAPQIRIRGYSSNGSSDPLYIVDGLKVSDISYLDPSNIQSMEVLKDAASAAIYGAEAGNGVVLITTKSGKAGNTRITFDAQWSFSSLAKKADVMNASQYTQWMTEIQGEGFTTLYNQYYVKGTDTDWQDELFGTGKIQKYTVGLEGGNDQGKFFLNLGYMNNDGMMVQSKDTYERINAQINASYKLRPWLEVSTQNTIANMAQHGMSEGSTQFGMMQHIMMSDPLTPVLYANEGQMPENVRTAIANGMPLTRNADGLYYYLPWTGNNNPMRGIEVIDKTSGGNHSFFVHGATSLNITPFKNFVFTSRLGYTLGNLRENNYTPGQWYAYDQDPTQETQALNLSSGQYTTKYYQWENFANYLWETGFMGNFGFMAGMSYSDYRRDFITAKVNELSNTAPNYRYLSYATNGATKDVTGDVLQKRQIAYYGRLSWDWLGRYNAQFNFRADSYDAAYLDLDHNWGFFPSVSVGWTFSQEKFMEKALESGILSYGKLRASYGVNGSVSNLGSYQYATTVQTGIGETFYGNILENNTYYTNGQLYQGTRPSSKVPNANLRWEESKQVDLGLDLRFFRDRLTATIDYYYKLTDGLIVESVAPLTTGAVSIYQNLGKVTNSGLEFELEWRSRIGKDFGYGIKANLATVNNNVKEYKGEGTRISGARIQGGDVATFFEEGYPIWYILGYQLEGVDPETGMAKYFDKDGNGDITADDRVNLGSAIPDFTYGATLSLDYKGFDLSVYGAGAYGNKLMYGMLHYTPSNRPLQYFEDRWTSGNRNAALPSAQQQVNDTKFRHSSAAVFDASYFKIKQIQFGYTLPKNVLKKLGFVQNCHLYCSLDNFFTFTSYPGSDPEANAMSGSGNGAAFMALDNGSYPLAKSVSVGFNIGF